MAENKIYQVKLKSLTLRNEGKDRNWRNLRVFNYISMWYFDSLKMRCICVCINTHTEKSAAKMTKMIRLFKAGVDTYIIFYTCSILETFHLKYI